jgi:hypothetical protein
LTTLFATILIACGKVNFTNLSRYSSLSEKTYRRKFEKPFDFMKFNAQIIRAVTAERQPMIAGYALQKCGISSDIIPSPSTIG